MIDAVSNVVIAVLWAAVAVYAISTAKALAMLVLERRMPTIKPEEEVVIPEDLYALALSESETWAQEEVLRAIRESYDTHKDWNRVRFGMGVGQRGDA